MKLREVIVMNIEKKELQRAKFPEFWNYDVDEREVSHVGKIRTRHRVLERYNRLSYPAYGLIAAKKLRDATSEGSYEEVVSLVSQGADVKKADLKGRTALHFAACRGNSSIVQLLIDNGASVNASDCNGSTPLHLGTIVDAVDDKGITPLRLAHARLRIARDRDDEGGLPLSRKTEVCRIVEMLKEFLVVTHSSKDETTELEELACKLSLSETSKQVDEVQSLLEGFTSLSIQRRELQTKPQPPEEYTS